MCMFSGRVNHVAGTRIFARHGAGKRTQFLAYDMRFEASEPVAMILPLPVAPGQGERAVRFIDLEGYPAFFPDLDRAFQPPLVHSMTRGFFGAKSAKTLVVEQVGNFVATYVPSLRDFARVDPRFRLAPQVWNNFPTYKDYGFAVFQFDANRAAALRTPKHPMAFEFPTRHASALYFPTVHVHDEQVHPVEGFDHQLYFQGNPLQKGMPFPKPVMASTVHIPNFRPDLTQGIYDASVCTYRGELRGQLPNRDTFVPVG